ncbi:hypothetical protein, partial [Aliarcobacter butzleri]|uniref:hypothetical protein n=1 Tax=Aliarcobacter butzleri TaxID=28197 RepID=UPI001D18FC75
LILIIGFYLLVSGLRPFYCPVELRFCVRPHSDIGVQFRPIFAINSYNTVLELKSIFKESVNLHFIDKENNSFYKNVDDAFIINKIGEKF